jgi:hypothetical protein
VNRAASNDCRIPDRVDLLYQLSEVLPELRKRCSVIPAKAGIQSGKGLSRLAAGVDLNLPDYCLRGNNGRGKTASRDFRALRFTVKHKSSVTLAISRFGGTNDFSNRADSHLQRSLSFQ